MLQNKLDPRRCAKTLFPTGRWLLLLGIYQNIDCVEILFSRTADKASTRYPSRPWQIWTNPSIGCHEKTPAVILCLDSYLKFIVKVIRRQKYVDYPGGRCPLKNHVLKMRQNAQMGCQDSLDGALADACILEWKIVVQGPFYPYKDPPK